MHSATVTVPCSTSNLGSGFDTLGLALALHNRITVTQRRDRNVRIASQIAASDRPAAEALTREAVDLFFEHSAAKGFGIDISVEGEVPIGRGLGYSATLRAGIIAGLNHLTGDRLTRDTLLHLVTRLEGHPDNASPAIFGGFTVSGIIGNQTHCLHFDVDPTLNAVTLIPKFQVRTSASRKLMPKEFSRADAAHALNRSALIVAAFASKNYEMLGGVFDDRFHQPYRLKLVPQLNRVIEAGVNAGAIGGFLSGSGSSIICLTLRDPDQVGAAMRAQLRDSEIRILTPANQGLHVHST